MADWRYIATRLNGNGTETVLHSDLPLGNVSITETLSGPQALKAVILPEIATLVAADGQPIFDAWSTAIYAEKDGQIRAGGILTDMTANGPSLDLDCLGFTGYAKDMPYTGTDYVTTGADALDVVRMIWAHLQAQKNGNLGLVLDTDKCNVKVGAPSAKGATDAAFRINWYTTHDLFQIQQDLVKTAPFDYREVHSWSGETIAHRLEFGVPTIGRRREDLRFMVGENISLPPDVTLPGDFYASEVLALGAGEGAKMVRGKDARSSETRLRRVAVLDDKTMNTKAKADTFAKNQLAMRDGRPEIDSIKVFDHPNAPLGSWTVGDEILVQHPLGWQGDLALWLRVLAFTTTPDDETVATLSVIRADRI